MQYKIINYDSREKIYELMNPQTGAKYKYYNNVGLNLLVGKNAKGAGITDCFYPKLISDLYIELEPAIFIYNFTGYIEIRTPGTEKDYYPLHQIVAFSWCKNPNTKYARQVDHINRDKDDNTPENLRYVSAFYNSFREWVLGNQKGKDYVLDKIVKATDPEEIVYAMAEIMNDKTISEKYKDIIKQVKGE
jgi:hypothetical protein